MDKKDLSNIVFKGSSNKNPIDADYRYTYYINRDALREDLIKELTTL